MFQMTHTGTFHVLKKKLVCSSKTKILGFYIIKQTLGKYYFSCLDYLSQKTVIICTGFFYLVKARMEEIVICE